MLQLMHSNLLVALGWSRRFMTQSRCCWALVLLGIRQVNVSETVTSGEKNIAGIATEMARAWARQ